MMKMETMPCDGGASEVPVESVSKVEKKTQSSSWVALEGTLPTHKTCSDRSWSPERCLCVDGRGCSSGLTTVLEVDARASLPAPELAAGRCDRAKEPWSAGNISGLATGMGMPGSPLVASSPPAGNPPGPSDGSLGDYRGGEKERVWIENRRD